MYAFIYTYIHACCAHTRIFTHMLTLYILQTCNWGVAAFYYKHATYHNCKNLGGAKYLCSHQQK